MDHRSASLQMRYDAQKKSEIVAYLLWFFLAVLGAHRFYLRRYGSAVAILLLSVTIVGLIVTVPWCLIDLFLIPSMVKSINLVMIRDLERCAA